MIIHSVVSLIANQRSSSVVHAFIHLVTFATDGRTDDENRCQKAGMQPRPKPVNIAAECLHALNTLHVQRT